MSEVAGVMLDTDGAKRITERIRLTLDSTSRNLSRLAELVTEAYTRRADLALGYGSWAEYSNAEFGEETRDLAPQFRRQLVGMLSAEGMSTRAIAPAVGVSRQAVSKELRHPEVATKLPPEPPAPSGSTLATPSGVVIAEQRNVELVDTNTGEIAETAPEPRKVTGLDGKQYTPPTPKPKRHVIDTAEEAELVNAKTAAQRIGSSLMTLDAFTVRQHRQRILFRWWPLGKEFVPPDERELFQPSRLRDIADGLNQLALDMEAQEQ